MPRLLIIAIFNSALFAQDRGEALPASWKMSLAPLVAAHSLDVASSWGYIETNPLLAGPNGRFGMRSASVKFGIVGAAIAVEYLVLRRHPKMAKLFTRGNYFNAAITGGIAARNYAVTH